MLNLSGLQAYCATTSAQIKLSDQCKVQQLVNPTSDWDLYYSAERLASSFLQRSAHILAQNYELRNAKVR